MGWYSFRVPSADTNRARWAVTDFWRALSRWGVHDAGANFARSRLLVKDRRQQHS
jgi:hypothetical protein